MRVRRGHNRPSKLNWVHIAYGLGVKLEKFDMAGLNKEMERISNHFASLEKNRTSFLAIVAAHTPLANDYHVHLGCHWTKAEFHASVEYFRGTGKLRPGKRQPFAENIMQWLGQFFRNDKATARVNATFVYSSRHWTASLPLPMRLPTGLPREAEIVGMIANIPTKPEGTHEAFVNLHNRNILVALDANRLVKFRGFNLYADVAALSSVARLFVWETKK